MKHLIKNQNNFVLSIAMIALGLFLALDNSLAGKSVSNLGGFWAQPDTYIKLLGGGLVIFSILLLISSLNFERSENVEKIHFTVTAEAIITAVALVVYCYLMPVITFFPATLLLVFGLNRLYLRKERSAEGSTDADSKNLQKTIKSMLVSLLYSVCITAAMWLIFTKFLKAVLP